MTTPKKKNHFKRSLFFAVVFACITLITNIYFFGESFSLEMLLKSISVAGLAAIPFYFVMKAWDKIK